MRELDESLTLFFCFEFVQMEHVGNTLSGVWPQKMENLGCSLLIGWYLILRSYSVLSWPESAQIYKLNNPNPKLAGVSLRHFWSVAHMVIDSLLRNHTDTEKPVVCKDSELYEHKEARQLTSNF